MSAAGGGATAPVRVLRACVAAIALAALLAACGGEPEVRTLPEVTLSELDGPERVDLAEITGPAVVNLWASWCGPCREELPLAERFHQQHGDVVRMIGIDFQDVQRDQALALARRSGLTYQQLSDPDGLLDGADPFPPMQGLPFWAFVDAEGHVVHREFVAIESVEQLEDLVETHLAVTL